MTDALFNVLIDMFPKGNDPTFGELFGIIRIEGRVHRTENKPGSVFKSTTHTARRKKLAPKK